MTATAESGSTQLEGKDHRRGPANHRRPGGHGRLPLEFPGPRPGCHLDLRLPAPEQGTSISVVPATQLLVPCDSSPRKWIQRYRSMSHMFDFMFQLHFLIKEVSVLYCLKLFKFAGLWQRVLLRHQNLEESRHEDSLRHRQATVWGFYGRLKL